LNQNFELKELGQIKYFKCRPLDNTNLVINAFTTRTGGASITPFDSLNTSYNVQDKENCVLENRKNIFNVLNIDYQNIVSAQQVHKDKIALVKKEDMGKGAFKYLNGIAETDALITNIPAIPFLF
jgi:copper oxidase (laccase) domain-containing protein